MLRGGISVVITIKLTDDGDETIATRERERERERERDFRERAKQKQSLWVQRRRMPALTYYDVLAIAPGASALDIKRAYRKLALQHHPDRNGGSAEATAKFKEIGEAYQVLSNDQERAFYDRTLRSGGGSEFRQHQQQRGRGHGGSGFSHADPFGQFNNLFRNDPFFSDAFKDMDDVFSRTFQAGVQGQGQGQQSQASSGSAANMGWCAWVCSMLGINFQMTTMTSDGSGGYSSTSFTNSRGSRASYTARSTRTVTEQGGRQVTIQSMQRNGNQIEDKYVGSTLVERRINGVPSEMDRIGQ